jgi:biotin transport system substrate-specific component
MSTKPGITLVPSESRIHPLLADGIIVIAASLFVAICAHIAIPLWFTPVPLTLQPFAVLLTGLTLGSRRGLAALVLYLAEGVAGLPVFNPLGPGGIAQLLGPTGGYLMSYPIAAFVAGYAAERLPVAERRLSPALDILFGALSAELVMFVGGALWFWTLTHYETKTILAMSVFPFLPGEAIKVAFASALALQWRRFRKN